MLAIVDPKDGTIRIFRIVIIDTVIISLLTWLIVLHVVPLYPTAVIGYPTLFIANFLIIRKVSKRRPALAKKPSRVPKALRFAALVFTTGTIVQLVAWIRDPDVRSTIQAIGLRL
jgi:hypothetical protein